MKKYFFGALVFLMNSNPAFSEDLSIEKIDDTPNAEIIKNASLNDIINNPQTIPMSDVMDQDNSSMENIEEKAAKKFYAYKMSKYMSDYKIDLDSSFIKQLSESKNINYIRIKDVSNSESAECEVGKPEKVNKVILQFASTYPNGISSVSVIHFGVMPKSFLHPLTSEIRCVIKMSSIYYKGDPKIIPNSDKLVGLTKEESETGNISTEKANAVNNGIYDGYVFSSDYNSSYNRFNAVRSIADAIKMLPNNAN